MQQFSQKYAIVQLLEDLPEGFECDWKNWPLHVTLADVFAIEWPISTLCDKLEKFASLQPTFSTKALGDEFFGSNKDIRVVLIDKTKELSDLHMRLVQLLDDGNVKFNNPEYTLGGFLPHSTVQPHIRLHKDDAVPFKALTIIDMFPDGDPYRRKIIKTLPLGMSQR